MEKQLESSSLGTSYDKFDVESVAKRQDNHLYNEFSAAQDAERTNVHYDMPSRLFEVLTGGYWHCYSCNIWDGIENPDPNSEAQQTLSQEKKLDVFARMAEMKPGSRVLDIGFGWGGPSIYFAKKYGVEIHGLALSQVQLEYAREWATLEGIDANFQVCHWEEYEPDKPFDAIVTDEVIVHIFRLEAFFKKCFSLLRDGGVMVNKELHMSHPGYGRNLTRSEKFINALYGETGNYRALGDELVMAYNAGFCVEQVRQLRYQNYELTAQAWYNNVMRHKKELIELVGKKAFKGYCRYLSLVIAGVGGVSIPYPALENYWVQCRKLPRDLRRAAGLEVDGEARGLPTGKR